MKGLLTHGGVIGSHSLLFTHRAVSGWFIRKISEFITR